MTGLFRNAPPDWRSVRLKDTITACRNGAWGEEPAGTTADSICVRVANFDRLRLRVNLSEPTWRFIPESIRAAKTLRRGNLLLEKSGGGEHQPVGTVVLYDDDTPAVCSNFIACMDVAPGFDSRYLCYLHAALYFSRVNCRSINQTTGIQNLDAHSYLSDSIAKQRSSTSSWKRSSVCSNYLRNSGERSSVMLFYLAWVRFRSTGPQPV